MKRPIGIIAGVCLAITAWAQAPFTIVRPADNSKVREKVRIMIPKNSIPEGGYVGFFVGGKFIEALLPNLNGKFYEYVLDTKGRNIPDGNVKVEAVLYMDGQDSSPRILDRSSISVSVQNSASIKVPAGGFTLRYRFQPGTEMIYRSEERNTVSIISEAEAKMGGRAAELPLESEKFRILYGVDNAYSNGDGLLRIQPVPPAGKDFLYASATGEAEPRLWMAEQLTPVYMRVNSTGNEIFGSIPTFYGIEGSSGASVKEALMMAMPLPTLPAKAVKPGDSWASRFQMPKLDMVKLHEVSSIVERLGARGEFMGVEWEMGHPCAKLRNIITVGARSLEGAKARAANREFSDEKTQLEQTYWFALDKRVIVKSILNQTQDVRVQGPGAGGGTQGGMRTQGGPVGPPGGGGGGDLPGGTQGDRGIQGRGGPSSGTQGGRLQPSGGGPQRPGGQNRGPNGGGGAPAAAQWARIRTQLIMVLEK